MEVDLEPAAAEPARPGPQPVQRRRPAALAQPRGPGHHIGLQDAPPPFPVRAYGLRPDGGAALAGGIAQLASPATAMTVMAAASIVVTLPLAPALLRRRAAPPEGQRPEPSAPRSQQSEVNSP